MRYENTAGVAAAAPDKWPSGSSIKRSDERATLVVLAHPHCPCTRATIHELGRLMAKLGDNLAVYVIFFKPDGVEVDWEKSDSWASAAEIRGVNVVSDDQGAETRLFDAHTSGQSMLYDKNGKLLFSGGITIGRGEQGDSVGVATIVSLVNGEAAPVHATSVFGCPLFSNDRYCHPETEPLNAKSTR